MGPARKANKVEKGRFPTMKTHVQVQEKTSTFSLEGGESGGPAMLKQNQRAIMKEREEYG